MNTLRYETVNFNEFADLVSGGISWINVPCTITVEAGLITQAVLDSSWYSYGISYESFQADTGFDDLQESLGMAEEEVLNAYFTLEEVMELDFAESRGTETAEVYTGNTGDGDSGLVLFKNSDGELLCSASAHTARAGWNTIYLGEADGVGFFRSPAPPGVITRNRLLWMKNW